MTHSPALDWADSGAMSLTGTAEGAPRFASGPIATVARGLGSLLAQLAPDSTLPRLDAAALLAERAALTGLQRNGMTSAGGHAHLLSTRSGWMAVNLAREDDWLSVPAWLEVAPESIAAENLDSLRFIVQERSAPELVARGRLLGLAVAAAPQPDASPLSSPPPAQDGTLRRPRSSPMLRTIESERAPRPLPQGTQRARVLDLSSLWAGPLAGSLLAEAGFDVLKIESPQRPDGARSGPAPFFDLMNAGKSGCALDLLLPSDRATFERLLDDADILIESARPRGLEQIGYRAENWVAEKPGRLWISVTGYGRSEPERDWIAYGDDAAIAAGLAWSPNESDPSFCADAIADPLTGLHAAASALAHWQAGIGGLLDLSLVAVAEDALRWEAGPLCANRVFRAGRFALETEAGLHPIAEPQARPVRGPAPALARPSEAFLSSWMAPC